MQLIDKLKTPSPAHRVSLTGNGFSIMPVDASKHAFEEFQIVAEEAMKYAEDDYKVSAVHKKNSASYTRVYFHKTSHVH
ncbi:hypothetical protein LG200_01800 [Methylobacillus caricis]|uniref:hypothetical protein n=1 Tax=Methylobacillus caricis TaxID=1971611 RepID=UPI001CFFB9D5|nr:hypothetical protein [Methylobacillus caricis]MCB5186734.1 hypothetical protein [Methylobacillus caricis]